MKKLLREIENLKEIIFAATEFKYQKYDIFKLRSASCLHYIIIIPSLFGYLRTLIIQLGHNKLSHFWFIMFYVCLTYLGIYVIYIGIDYNDYLCPKRSYSLHSLN